MVQSFYPCKITSLGIAFVLQFQANKMLGLVRIHEPKALKYLGNISCYVVFSPRSLCIFQLGLC